jgi:hypothetical protein
VAWANGRIGEGAKRRRGETAPATKWHNRIAQGFSPGFGCLRNRPEGATERLFARGLC